MTTDKRPLVKSKLVKRSSPVKLSRSRIVLTMAAFIGLGAFLIYRSMAATVAGTLEGEAMTLPSSGASIVADSSASGGQTLKLTALGTASGSLTTTQDGTTVALRAKGVQCQGAPQATIQIDGVNAVLASVSATSWTTYTAAVTSKAGSHTVTAALTNPFSTKASRNKTACTRQLYIDNVQVLGADPTPTPVADTAAPTVALASPTGGATVSGTVNVSANASDNVGVTKVEFLVNGGVASTQTATPYAYTWDTIAVSNGAYTLTAKAYDAAGNVGTSSAVAVTVNNAPTTPAAGPAGPSGNWTMVFDDEFNGTALDTTKWNPNWFGEGGKMNNVGTYAANVTESNGSLNLTLASSTSGALVHTGYTAGRYQLPVGGYAEASVYFPGGSNTTCNNWPAWWASGPSWPAAGEHDIAEVLSGQLTVNYHSPSGSHNQGAVPGTWCGAYHTYGVQRLASSANVYWDGVLVKTYATDDNGGGEELILNVGNGGPVPVYGAASQVKVDWVRAWTPAP